MPFLPPELCRGLEGLLGVEKRENPLPKMCGEGMYEGIRGGCHVKEGVRVRARDSM